MRSHAQLAAPSIIASPERFDHVKPLGKQRYVKFTNFLQPDVAKAVHYELHDGLKYERVDYAGLSRQWRAERQLGDVYFGSLQTHEGWQTSEVVQACYDLFAHSWFEDLLSRLMGCPIVFLRPATPYRLEYDDRICLHDDLSDPCHHVSVVLGFTKDWRREYGGNTVIGEVTRIEDLPTPPEIPFQLRRWYLGRSRAVLMPEFNALTVMRLAPGLAHGVTPVRAHRVRLSLVSIYGSL